MQTLLRCRKFEVVHQDVPGHDGRVHRHEVVIHPGAVVILPLLADRSIVMIHNMRHAVGKELLELPAGTLDRDGEDERTAAFRELEEETGYRADRLDWLCEFYPSPGVLSECIRAYVATGLTPSRQRLEATERIRVEEVTREEALARIDRGEIVDAKTIITILRWDRSRRTTE
jgi:ADP-ribose pyrophosphatase